MTLFVLPSIQVCFSLCSLKNHLSSVQADPLHSAHAGSSCAFQWTCHEDLWAAAWSCPDTAWQWLGFSLTAAHPFQYGRLRLKGEQCVPGVYFACGDSDHHKTIIRLELSISWWRDTWGSPDSMDKNLTVFLDIQERGNINDTKRSWILMKFYWPSELLGRWSSSRRKWRDL